MDMDTMWSDYELFLAVRFFLLRRWMPFPFAQLQGAVKRARRRRQQRTQLKAFLKKHHFSDVIFGPKMMQVFFICCFFWWLDFDPQRVPTNFHWESNGFGGEHLFRRVQCFAYGKWWGSEPSRNEPQQYHSLFCFLRTKKEELYPIHMAVKLGDYEILGCVAFLWIHPFFSHNLHLKTNPFPKVVELIYVYIYIQDGPLPVILIHVVITNPIYSW